MIKYVYISNYGENYKSNDYLLNDYETKKEYYKQLNNNIYETTPDEYIYLLKKKYKNSEYSLLEVIPEDKVNIFFDIDYIPLKYNSNLIQNNIIFIKFLIIKLMNFFGFVKYPVITTNKYKSFHLIFPYYTNLMYLNHMIISFINIYNEYKNVIDTSIYTPYFLFRSIGSYKPAKPGQIRKNTNYHKILYIKNYSINDIKQSLIQYTLNSEYYKPRLIIENYRNNINNLYKYDFKKYKYLFIISFIINCLLIYYIIINKYF